MKKYNLSITEDEAKMLLLSINVVKEIGLDSGSIEYHKETKYVFLKLTRMVADIDDCDERAVESVFTRLSKSLLSLVTI